MKKIPGWLELDLGDVQLVLYHHNCRDGFAAAAVVHERFPNATYLPVQYGWDTAKEVLLGGKTIIYVDFCPEQDVVEEILEARWQNWLVIDHHESREWVLDYNSPERIHAVYDLEYSGAVLAWKVFFPGKKVPQLLSYVQDRDLWKWSLEHSREVSAAVSQWPLEFEVWKEAFRNFRMESEVREGKGILRTHALIYESAAKKSMLVRLNGTVVRMVNATTLISETCNHILGTRQDVDIAVCFFFLDPVTVVLSFRARQGADALTLAESLGGGGHREACGARMTLEDFHQVLEAV